MPMLKLDTVGVTSARSTIVGSAAAGVLAAGSSLMTKSGEGTVGGSSAAGISLIELPLGSSVSGLAT